MPQSVSKQPKVVEFVASPLLARILLIPNVYRSVIRLHAQMPEKADDML